MIWGRMADQRLEEERDEKRAVLKAVFVDLARQAAWNDHLTSLKPRKNGKRMLMATGGKSQWRNDNNIGLPREDKE